MIGGIPNASIFPTAPSLVAKETPKPFVEKIKEQKEEKKANPTSESSLSKNLQKPLDRPSTATQLRYGAAPSKIERNADTGLNTTGLRKYEPPAKPEPVQKLEETRGGRQVDRLEDSPSDRNQVAGIITRAPRDPSEITPQENLKGTEHRPSLEMANAASPPVYQQVEREYLKSQEAKRVGRQLDIQA